VKQDEQFYRPAEVDRLMGDAAKARRVLSWQPGHTFQQLVDEMVESDLEAAARSMDRSPSLFGDSAGAGTS
jgi:GDPmannose 4,6-dehydratase